MSVILYDGTFTGTTSTGATFSKTGVTDIASVGTVDEWEDYNGSVYNVVSDVLTGTFLNSYNLPLLRPLSESATDQQIDVYFTYPGSGVGNQVGAVLRTGVSGGGYSFTYYWIVMRTGPNGNNPNHTAIYSIINNSVNSYVLPETANGYSWVVGHNYKATFTCTTSGSGTILAVSVYDLTVGGGAVFTQTGTDTTTSITGPGGFGLNGWNAYGDNLTASRVVTTSLDAGSALTPGTVSISSITGSSVTITTTAATGGAGSYTYKYQLAPDVSGSAGTYADLNSGAYGSSLTYSATGLSSGVYYWARSVVKDSSSNTATGTGVRFETSSSIPVLGPISVIANDETGITISWSAATEGTGTGYSYAIYYDTTAPFTPPSSGTHAGTTSSLSYKITSPPSGEIYVRVVCTDSGSNVGVSTQSVSQGALPTRLGLSPWVIGQIGTSITAYGCFVNLESNLQVLQPLRSVLSSTTHSTLNQGVAGSTSGQWVSGSTNLNNALSAFSAVGGVNYCTVELGTNDAKNGSGQVSVETFATNLANICATLIAAGITPLLQESSYVVPGSYSEWDETSLVFIVAYNAAKVSLASGSGGTILLISPGVYDYFRLTPSLLSDGVHPTSGGNSAYSLLGSTGVIEAIMGGSSGGSYPSETDVRYGVSYNGSSVGSCNVPTSSQVLFGVDVDATTGNVVLPTDSQVESGVTFGPSSGMTGSYTGGGSGVTLEQLESALASGITTLDLSQSVPTSNTSNTIGDALNAARAAGLGKVIYNPTANTFTLYAPDNSTIVKEFTVTTDSNGNILERV